MYKSTIASCAGSQGLPRLLRTDSNSRKEEAFATPVNSCTYACTACEHGVLQLRIRTYQRPVQQSWKWQESPNRDHCWYFRMPMSHDAAASRTQHYKPRGPCHTFVRSVHSEVPGVQLNCSLRISSTRRHLQEHKNKHHGKLFLKALGVNYYLLYSYN